MTTATIEAREDSRVAYARAFCPADVSAYDTAEWTKSDAVILEFRPDGTTREVFRQDGVEFPAAFSQQAREIVASKYFYGPQGKGDDPYDGGRESSLRQLAIRICRTIATWSHADGYLDVDGASRFNADLAWLLIHQHAAFNSPVEFNCGLWDVYGIEGTSDAHRWDSTLGRAVKVGAGDAYKYPQCSACFIIGVADDMESIAARAVQEMMLFKYGSGAGSDNSTIRSRRERLSGGGRPSGPLSFMQIYDAVASVIKSGGKTRRAAKMETLKCVHPDILEFIEAKPKEEAKARALVAQGYSTDFNHGAPSEVRFQNSNFSVRATDEFMRRASSGEDEEPIHTIAVTTGTEVNTHGERMPEYSAYFLLDKIAEGTWACGDPGLQFEDTIQRWHTCPNTAPINSSNPCCFIYATLVDTSEGKIPIGRLAEMDAAGEELPHAFAFDLETGLPVLRKIKKAWKAGSTSKLFEVETDKGLVFRCTPAHKFLTYSGEYVQANELKPGQRLRKINRHTYANGRKKLILPGKSNAAWQSRWMWEQANGPIPDGREVHHKNDDGSDDRLSNFELKEAGIHQAEHQAGDRNPRYIDRDAGLILDTWDKLTANGNTMPSSATWNRYVQNHALTGRVPQFSGNVRKHAGQTWGEFVEWVDEQRAAVNDRVKSIRPYRAGRTTDVYDIEVEGTHNFTISLADSDHGIVVANSEYMFIDNSACNLASINLMKFRRDDGAFDAGRFRAAVRAMIIAQDVLVDRAGYPSAAIAENSHKFRPLGLGYCNLGALVMSLGLPYDSAEARALCGAITALMHGQAYLTSAGLAAAVGPFEGYADNRAPMLRVIGQHRDAAVAGWEGAPVPRPDRGGTLRHRIIELWHEAANLWDDVVAAGTKHGFRNSQVTVLAPTGTIAFMMDADTTGIEPEIALVKYKKLAGGGTMKIVNQTVPLALATLGYDESDVEAILRHVRERDTIEGAPHLEPAHLPVFDCAFPPPGGGRSIAMEGHLRMMAAAQPFLSGAISKTINAPHDATVAQVRAAYVLGWELDLKAVAIYRDGSKGAQPVSTRDDAAIAAAALVDPVAAALAGERDDLRAQLAALEKRLAGLSGPYRRKLPRTRESLTHHFEINGHGGYFTVGLYPDTRQPGELFITMAKEGSTVGGLMDVIGAQTSFLLQYGAPLEALVEKFAHVRFEPAGFTGDPDVPIAKSIVDYVFRWLGVRYVPGYQGARTAAPPEGSLGDDPAPMALPAAPAAARPVAGTPGPLPRVSVGAPRADSAGALMARLQSDAPACDLCGAITVRAGTCYRCFNCGNSLGCS